MSLVITNHVLSNLLKTLINRDSPPSYGGDLDTSRSLETLLESSSKAYKQSAALVLIVLNVARFISIGTIPLKSLVVTRGKNIKVKKYNLHISQKKKKQQYNLHYLI